VKPFDIAEAFIERHARRLSLPELQDAFEKSLQDLGIRHFACCSHVDPLNPRNAGMVFQTYPADWVRYFSESGCSKGVLIPWRRSMRSRLLRRRN
jgi:Autoinducer binding domain